MKKSTLLIVSVIVMLSVLLLFPLRFLTLSYDPQFLTEFVSGWNHRIRALILENRLSYTQGMQLILNTHTAQVVLQRSLVVALGLQLLPIIMLAASLITRRIIVRRSLVVLAAVLTSIMIVPPIILVTALIIDIRKK